MGEKHKHNEGEEKTPSFVLHFKIMSLRFLSLILRRKNNFLELAKDSSFTQLFSSFFSSLLCMN